MTDLPTTGGSYVRDPETGKLLPQPRPEEMSADDQPVADVTPVAETEPAAPDEPAPKRRSISKGGI